MDQKRIVILGGGESGTGAAVLAKLKIMMFFFLTNPLFQINIKRYSINTILSGRKCNILLRKSLMQMR